MIHRHADEAGIADHIEQEFHPWRHRPTSCSAIMPISLFEIMTSHATQTERLRRKPAIRDGLKAREKAPKAYDESRPCGVARPALWTTKKAPCLTSSPHLSQFIVCRTIIDAIASGFSPWATAVCKFRDFSSRTFSRVVHFVSVQQHSRCSSDGTEFLTPHASKLGPLLKNRDCGGSFRT